MAIVDMQRHLVVKCRGHYSRVCGAQMSVYHVVLLPIADGPTPRPFGKD